LPEQRLFTSAGEEGGGKHKAVSAANLPARHGGGNFVLMKDLSSPIRIRGRHWGAFRMGFRPVLSPLALT